jgi:type IV pilus assembly protein PilA
MTGAAKLAVAETLEYLGALPEVGNNSDGNAPYGLPPESEIYSEYVSGIAVLESGVIRVTYKENLGGNPSANGLTILFEPTIENNKIVKWGCSGGTQMAEYRPPQCT